MKIVLVGKFDTIVKLLELKAKLNPNLKIVDMRGK